MSKEILSVTCLNIFLLLVKAIFLLQTAMGDPRSQTIQIICGHQLEHNTTVYVPNFVATMENISNQIQASGFGISVKGSGPDASYGLAQCYGDLSLVDCVLCYAEARTVLPQCFPYSGGRIFLDGCFMRAENYSFFQQYTGPGDTVVCGNTTQKNSTFEESAREAVMQAISTGPKNKGYARVNVAVPGMANDSVYVLAHCWMSLIDSSCLACLKSASASMLGCLPWSEGRALNTGCYMRYSDTDFLNDEQRNGRSRWSIVVIGVSVVSSIVVLVTLIVTGVRIWMHRSVEKKRRVSNDVEKLVKTLNNSNLNFKYSIVEKATASFADTNKLGQGGFGTVYKGVLPDGREMAVKRLFFNNRHRAANFYNEVNMISSVDHKNLVRLLGCSCSGPESLLIYEYLPNKSLDLFIFDSSKGKALTWEKRFEIIIGTAEGLAYLHENSVCRMIHRDIKTSNILLDSKFRAKIADFGLARSFQEDKNHISTAIAGTLGYMAPEYLAHGQLTEKADVYSFGVLLLETVTGRQNNRSKSSEYSDSLVTAAWKHFLLGTIEELYDPNLMLHIFDNSDVKHEVLRVVHIGLLCTQEIPSLRPLMSKVHKMLIEKDGPLPTPTNPPFIDEKTMELNGTYEKSSYPLKPADPDSIATITNSSVYAR